MRQDNRQGVGAAALCGVLPVVWLALLTAPYLAGGLPGVIEGFPKAMDQPFRIGLHTCYNGADRVRRTCEGEQSTKKAPQFGL